ncbi:hypothetical protein OPW07_00925 [Vibrio europaeus]|nr:MULTISPECIES: hypothetical protein [Vibrio oreintalis group]MDC5808288.1 hypothetical protein [Vibrio europaeus]
MHLLVVSPGHTLLDILVNQRAVVALDWMGENRLSMRIKRLL